MATAPLSQSKLLSRSNSLALLAPLLAEPYRAESSTALKAIFDHIAPSVDTLLSILDYHGVTLLLASKHSLPTKLQPALLERKAMVVASEGLRSQALLTLFSQFSAAGLAHFILFKGGAVAHTIYQQPWHRPRSDADILIDEIYRPLANSVLANLGYQKEFAIEGKYVSYQSSYSLTLPGGSKQHIDLHWRINNRQALAQAYSVEQLHADGQSLNALHDTVVVPSTVDNLLIACLHRLGHHATEERLIWLYDIHLLASKLQSSDWQVLLSKSRHKQLCAIVADGLATCQTRLGTIVPDTIMTSLSDSKLEPSALFVNRDLPEWRYFMRDLKSMPSLSARAGLIRETVLPPAAYVRQQMGTNSTSLAYMKRLIRGIKRVRGA
ncbi:nucleotidyltransferase family protein [Arenicella xantha]|uniref:Putative nucleotidyltransferase-like protein n=1 Tax=Arenicella xantha TaxID=644221 RepID=A0A395JF69_9GAMM|nr:nucleotidyltransferase family protein [Arenicella xantha]RBP48283.1 putative nucleotidyltransferase-like protein [Arenicella xantha]